MVIFRCEAISTQKDKYGNTIESIITEQIEYHWQFAMKEDLTIQNICVLPDKFILGQCPGQEVAKIVDYDE